VQANEGRISNLNHGIVNLEEEYGCDTTFLHVCQASVLFERRDGSAVAIGAHENMAGLIENDFAVCRQCRPNALLEKDHIFLGHAKIIVFSKVRLRGSIVYIACHDVERDPRVIACAEP